MRKIISVVALMAIMVLSVAVFPIRVAAVPDTKNAATFYLDHYCSYGTSEDDVNNTYLAGDSSWSFYMYNQYDDTGEAIINPNMTIVSDLTFERFYGYAWGVWYDPFPPNVTSPPVYKWYWNRNLDEGEDVGIGTYEPYGTGSFKPGFSLSRSVTPSTIISPKMVQIVKVTFRLEEPLPENTGGIDIWIYAGTTEEASPTLKSVSPLPNYLYQYPGYADIEWWLPVEELVIGETYTFKAVFLTTKLVKGPVQYKPYVGAGYVSSPGYRLYGTGKSVTVTNPGVTGTYSADNEIEWWTDAPYIVKSVSLWLISGAKAIKTECPLMRVKQ